MLASKQSIVVFTFCLFAGYCFSEAEIRSNNILGKNTAFHRPPVAVCIVRYRERYLKRRTVYSAGHPGSYNPSLITNQEAHMIYGNMEITKSKERCKTANKKAKTISDYFSASPDTGRKYTVLYIHHVTTKHYNYYICIALH